MIKRNFEEESKDVDTHLYAYNFDYVLRNYMMKAFAPFFYEGSALELGCYKGEFTRLISQRYKDLTVVEAAENLIAHARLNVDSSVRFVHGTFEDVELDRQYDSIFFTHTLEHLDDPVSVLSRVDRWLSATGRLFLVVPNANAPSRQLAVKMGLVSHNTAVTPAELDHGHRITYTLDTLERDARLAGLKIVHRGGVFFKPFANFQFDMMLEAGIINSSYLDACYELGSHYPDLCASVFVICEKGEFLAD